MNGDNPFVAGPVVGVLSVCNGDVKWLGISEPFGWDGSFPSIYPQVTHYMKCCLYAPLTERIRMGRERIE